MNKNDKPKLTSGQLVKKLKDEKGVTFHYVSETEAEVFLREHNNYMRTASYRKNYLKNVSGSNKGKYIKLDFAYLQELSVIDMHFRHIISKMCLDIEHDLKVKLLNCLEDESSIDGYDIVDAFLKQNPYIVKKIEASSSSPFTNDLIFKYFTLQTFVNKKTGKTFYSIVRRDCPVWVLLELLSFGDFIRFYIFFYTSIGKSPKPALLTLINLTKSLRNGCAHNNCILANLSKGSSNVPAVMSKNIATIPGITKDQRLKKLSSRSILEFTAMLYLYNEVVSEKVKYYRIKELKKFINGRMIEKKGFFEYNLMLKSSYDFIKKVVLFVYT